MDYPQRIPNHVSESSSYTILAASLPSYWIVRELTERDYGIDLYIEIVREDGRVTGNLVALQVKSTNKIKFEKENEYIFKGIKRSTLNYWIGLPVPVFFVVVCLSTSKAYWANIQSNQREGRFEGKTKSVSIPIKKTCDFSDGGLAFFKLNYLRERQWPVIEEAIEKSLMFYNSLGPLVLMCRRANPTDSCSTTIQYLLIQHYEYYTTMARYLLGKKPKYLPHWYERNLEFIKEKELEASLTFCFAVINEMINDFVWSYRDCIMAAYYLVTKNQKDYFFNKFPYLLGHLSNRPHTFIADDWAARYFWDEYENETRRPEALFFRDFSEFDGILPDIIPS